MSENVNKKNYQFKNLKYLEKKKTQSFWVDSVKSYRISVSQMTKYILACRKQYPVLSSFMTYHQVCN